MTDFEKVVMLMATIERMRLGFGCWCSSRSYKVDHSQNCRDTQAAMKAAAYGMPEMETVKEGAD